MPWYRRYGKVLEALTAADFADGMDHGDFKTPKHRAFAVLLFYSAVRKQEALRSTRESFQLFDDHILFDVGARLKHGIETPALYLPLDAPYMSELRTAVESTQQGERVFPYCKMTGYNIVARVWKYPHLFRLSRITNFFLSGWTIAQVRSWTCLSLRALEFYVGIVDTIQMGKSLANLEPRMAESLADRADLELIDATLRHLKERV